MSTSRCIEHYYCETIGLINQKSINLVPSRANDDIDELCFLLQTIPCHHGPVNDSCAAAVAVTRRRSPSASRALCREDGDGGCGRLVDGSLMELSRGEMSDGYWASCTHPSLNMFCRNQFFFLLSVMMDIMSECFIIYCVIYWINLTLHYFVRQSIRMEIDWLVTGGVGEGWTSSWSHKQVVSAITGYHEAVSRVMIRPSGVIAFCVRSMRQTVDLRWHKAILGRLVPSYHDIMATRSSE